MATSISGYLSNYLSYSDNPPRGRKKKKKGKSDRKKEKERK